MLGGAVGGLILAAVVALKVGGVVGGTIVPKPAPKPQRPPETVRFSDTLTDFAIAYPATWVRRAPKDQQVRFVASSPDASAGVSVSVRRSGLDPITSRTLPVVRPLTDDLLRADKRITAIADPVAVQVGGLPGYRYHYTYRSSGNAEGAHIHYFLFKNKRLIQLVLQAVPSSQLATLEPTFARIAASFRGNRR